MSKLTETDYIKLAKEFLLEVKTIKAIVAVEASGSGFSSDGKIKIQFEPHVFAQELVKLKIAHTINISYANLPGGKQLRQYTIVCNGITITNGVEAQGAEYKAYESAKAINTEAAMIATSFGLGQIMGFNYKKAGFVNVAGMIEGFNAGEIVQLRGMLNFIKASGLIATLQQKNWAAFACKYNGPKYKDFNYDTRLQEAYLKA